MSWWWALVDKVADGWHVTCGTMLGDCVGAIMHTFSPSYFQTTPECSCTSSTPCSRATYLAWITIVLKSDLDVTILDGLCRNGSWDPCFLLICKPCASSWRENLQRLTQSLWRDFWSRHGMIRVKRSTGGDTKFSIIIAKARSWLYL